MKKMKKRIHDKVVKFAFFDSSGVMSPHDQQSKKEVMPIFIVVRQEIIV